jgi:hypothetical protein
MNFILDFIQGYKRFLCLHRSKCYFANYWLTTILIDPTETGGELDEIVRLKLLEENIESRPLWKPMHLQPVL